MGINTGEAIVGNIGSSAIKDYTVIGDSVNTAARLQSLTRQFSTQENICRLIISEATYQQVKYCVQVKSLGEESVKGKKIKIKIYEVVGLIQN